MKKALLILIVFCTSAIIANAQTQSQIYFIKSGYVKMKLGGNSEGTKELWWDDYGQKSCELEKSTTTTKVFGMKNTSENHKLTIIDNGQVWSVNYIDKTGSKTNVPLYKGKPINEMSEKEQKELVDKTLNQLGGKRLANEEFMGYNCDVIELLGSKAWSYKNVTLKVESKIMGIELTQTAEVFEPNASVPSSKFVAPKDIEYKEIKHQIDLNNMMDGKALQEAMEESNNNN